MEVNRKPRSSNWSEQEKKVLRKLVLEKASIIENKENSFKINAAKKIAWEEVASCFNTVCSSQRDNAQLQCQWRNFKNRAKKSEFAFRQARMLTGGGPPPSSPPAEDRELMEAIPQEFTVDSNIYDSDSINTQPLMSHPDPPQPETIHPAPAPVLPNVTKPQKSSPSSTPGKRPKSKKFKSDSCWEGHSQELFELAKKGKEEAMLREKEAHEHKMMHERELHKIRVRVASLEEEYWKNKILVLKKFNVIPAMFK